MLARRALPQAKLGATNVSVFTKRTTKGTLSLMRWLFGRLDWPITWLEGGVCTCRPIAGIQVLAVSGIEVEPIFLQDQVVGSVFNDGEARHCFLGGILPRDSLASRDYQTGQAYEQLEIALAQIGMDLSHLVRTWFFLDSILAWYREFNEVRNEVYVQRRLLEGLVPASTGIGGRNPNGAALTVGSWAMQPLHGTVCAAAAPSPLQCPAPTYGSFFSRAVEITAPDLRRLIVSGTASITPDGHTAHVGDLSGQIDLTFRVVKAILESRGMNFSNTVRAIAYLKRANDGPFFERWCRKRGLESLPMLTTRADVCRDDLLFELELDAIAPDQSCLAVNRETRSADL
ncbi:MAG: hypothetical protein FJ398_16955 [Verrucomicrobia bacterium]|nr:hypothetical protein [Verrucomicrobiota bacterium]